MKAKQSTKVSEQTFTASKVLNVQSLFIFLVFPLSQIVSFSLMAQEAYTVFEIPIPTLFIMTVGLLFFLILITYIFQKQYSKKHATQNYHELLNIQQHQKKHYEIIRQQREHLEHIKNSFENQLTELCFLLDANQPEEALSLLQTLTKEIESTREYPFCPNPIINAVLSNKKQECLEYQIAFHADMQISSCNSVDKLHLCSIFSNLLDNALEANKKITPPADRYIDLTAKQSGDYLHIKVKNPSLPPLSPKKGHGYGQKILNDIASKYSGTFRTHYENHTYEAYLCIQMP